ncbi:hypothetical protein N7456_002405 [Penicillium angulare]|uniref:Uncharacterized protein n=1 Tax=Penicillium angulare TaxID=116970 RepID=A0A9W9G883_9EURO|nr:hypothetical protein N7456_002405 [Penicillium angulare]
MDTTTNEIEEDLSGPGVSAPFTPEYIYADFGRYKKIISFEFKRLQQSDNSLLKRYHNTDQSRFLSQRRDHLEKINVLRSLDTQKHQSENSSPRSDFTDIMISHLPYDIPNPSKVAYETNYLLHSTCLVKFYFANLADYESFVNFDTLEPQRFKYLSQKQILVKMALPAHGTTAGVINNFINRELVQMGMRTDEELKTFNGQTISSDDGKEAKQASQAWGSFVFPPNYSTKKPTVVLEIGSLETAEKLKDDALFWLNPKKGAASIVITCKIDRQMPFIALEKWERPGTNGKLKITEVIMITKKTKAMEKEEGKSRRNEVQIELSKTTMTIPFGTLFRREPGPGQTDIIFDERMLKNLAIRAWEEQNFLHREI